MLLDRWSPRAMSGAGISHDELMRLFEAARWVPSSPNARNGVRSTLIERLTIGRLFSAFLAKVIKYGMAAVGRPASKEIVPEKLQERESPNDRRKVSESIFEGPFRHG